ncbi:polyprenyl synthetase [Methanosarcinales archaeon]|nr:MAG: polyprenyl synthetase [Methanosarcinales archaeon]
MYELIGIVISMTIVVSVVLALLALLISRISLNRHVWLAGVFADILDFFYLPIKAIFQRCADTRTLDTWMASLKNMAHRSAFAETKHRLLLTPHCMRSLDCPAPSTRFGIQCQGCGKCIFSKMVVDADRFGYTLYIIAGSSYVRHVIKKESADGALLVACNYELNKVMRALKRKDIVTYGVPLLTDGCYNTEVDYENLIAVLESFGAPHSDNHRSQSEKS